MPRRLHIERETRTNRRTGQSRVVFYQVWTADPFDGGVLVGEGATLREALQHADAARVVRPWVFGS